MKLLRSIIGLLFKHQSPTTDELREAEAIKAKQNGARNSSMSLFDEIQDDILSATPLSTVLRKAKVLAYRLNNQEFKDWVEHELNGYDGKEDALPDYRNVSTHSCGNFVNSAWKVNDSPIPTNNIPAEIRDFINEVQMTQGIRELESLLDTLDKNNSDQLALKWNANLLPLLHERVLANMYCMDAWRVITKTHITGIIDNTRNRLLTFILELAERYPDIARDGFKNAGREIPKEDIRQVFNYFIMGGKHNIVASAKAVSQGGDMTIFDQRGQRVNYQYNAVGNINFDSVQNRVDLVGELEKLKAEVSSAAAADAIDQEAATDAEYQITKAIQQAQKPEPNKQSIVEYLSGAMSVLKGVSAVAGIVTALAKAAELAQHLF